MPSIFTKGDIFASDEIRAYAHGCNCAGGMDAGIAVQFKARWPRMFEEYAARCADGRFALGDVFVWSDGPHTVYNLATQAHWRKKAQYPALAKSLRKMIELAKNAGIARVGVPRIGAGLGGLDWVRVRRLLAEVGEEEPKVELVVFEQFVRARAPTPDQTDGEREDEA